MGFEVSGTFLLIFFGLMVALGAMYTTFDNTSERVVEAQQERLADSMERAETAISIQSAVWNSTSGNLTIEVRNTGQTTLDLARTRILLDGEVFLPSDATELTVAGSSGTDLWHSGQVLRVVYGRNADRIRITTQYGITAFTRRTNTTRGAVVFNQTGDTGVLHGMKQDTNPVTPYGVARAQVTGPGHDNFDDDIEPEVPYVDENGVVHVVDRNGENRQLATGAFRDGSKLSVGTWDGSYRSVFYVEASTRNLRRVTNGGRQAPVGPTDGTIQADGVAGTADIDGDGELEFVYGGDNQGLINEVNYVEEDNSTVRGTGATYQENSLDSRIGLGEPANFNGSVGERVPIVDAGSATISLVSAGGRQELTLAGPTEGPQTGPLATPDWDADGKPEILYVEQVTGRLQYVDNVTSGNDVHDVVDADGNVVEVDPDLLAG